MHPEIQAGQHRNTRRQDEILEDRDELVDVVVHVAPLTQDSDHRAGHLAPPPSQIGLLGGFTLTWRGGTRYPSCVQPDAFTAEFDEATQSLIVAGDVDSPSAIELRDLIEKHTDHYAQPLVIDLSGVDYLPSAAVGVLATAQQQGESAGHAVDLLAAEGSIAERVLTVCAMPHRTS